MGTLRSLLSLLSGRKTYLLSALGVVVVVLQFLQVLDGEVGDTLLGLLGFGAASALRAGVARSLPKE